MATIVGTSGDDVLTGTDTVDTIDGLAGDDTISGGDGDDRLIDSAGTDTLSGGAGDDTVYVDAASDISGLAEVIDGGDGYDRLVFTQDGGIVDLSRATITDFWELNVADGMELTVTGAQLDMFGPIVGSGTLILSAPGTYDLKFRAESMTIRGSAGNDTILSSGIHVSGGEGDDTLLGGDGEDDFTGGAGTDILRGNNGADEFYIVASSDISGLNETIDGGNDHFRDRLIIHDGVGSVSLTDATITGVEFLSGGGTTITLTAAQLDAFSAFIVEDPWNQTMTLIASTPGTINLTGTGYYGYISIHASAGDDTILAGAVASDPEYYQRLDVDGGAGNDTITGGADDDSLHGDAGNDTITGGTEDPVYYASGDGLVGGAGDDILRGEGGADTLLGGDGVDTAGYDTSSAGVSVFLNTGAGHGGDAEGDRIAGIENVLGSQGNDRLVGNAVANVLEGWNGADLLEGGAGDDVLRGGAGADRLVGGDGVDTAGYDASPDGVVVSLNTGIGQGGDAEGDRIAGIENLSGSGSNDVLTGDGGANVLRGSDGGDRLDGGAGNDVLRGDGGTDRLIGGTGSDAASYYDRTTTVTVDLGAGTGGGDVLEGIENAYGGSGGDRLTGSAGANLLAGFDGADVLSGGGGNDTLRGGAGTDVLAGGAGADRFAFSVLGDSVVGADADRIVDFSQAQGDRINLSGIDADRGTAGNQAFTFIGSGLYTGDAGELRFSRSGGYTTVAGDVTGDGVSDFHILLKGTITLVAADFVL